MRITRRRDCLFLTTLNKSASRHGATREHFIEGKTIKEIARDLRVSRNTVREVLRSGETSFEYEREL